MVLLMLLWIIVAIIIIISKQSVAVVVVVVVAVVVAAECSSIILIILLGVVVVDFFLSRRTRIRASFRRRAQAPVKANRIQCGDFFLRQSLCIVILVFHFSDPRTYVRKATTMTPSRRICFEQEIKK
jgi:hypothetical protein